MKQQRNVYKLATLAQLKSDPVITIFLVKSATVMAGQLGYNSCCAELVKPKTKHGG